MFVEKLQKQMMLSLGLFAESTDWNYHRPFSNTFQNNDLSANTSYCDAYSVQIPEHYTELGLSTKTCELKCTKHVTIIQEHIIKLLETLRTL